MRGRALGWKGEVQSHTIQRLEELQMMHGERFGEVLVPLLAEENQVSDLEDVHRRSDTRLGRLNRGTTCEELAAERHEESVDEDIQEFEILVPQASGKQDHSSLSVSVNLGACIITGGGDVGEGGTTWERCNSRSGTVAPTETYQGSSEGSVHGRRTEDRKTKKRR
ncbi:hypothetical protein VIGAN_05218900 [Vigna angularis var. angularis]|uniref:Uncharacterized protein n=1 Tax=Vigna angularis var. angularis TaxID=157739 RepID=A0A0S3S726_PHAAN|nr:hypothetical protein VIGAN_05218900 [Vigna angularis var. angularis]